MKRVTRKRQAVVDVSSGVPGSGQRNGVLTGWFMPVPELDIIKEIKEVEAEAKRLITAAEQKKVQAVEQTEAQAKAEIEQMRQRLQADFNEALARAEEEAERLCCQIVEEAKKRAQTLKNLPEERLRQAVEMLVRSVIQKWQ